MLSFRQIAKLTNQDLSTVHRRYKRAKKSLGALRSRLGALRKPR